MAVLDNLGRPISAGKGLLERAIEVSETVAHNPYSTRRGFLALSGLGLAEAVLVSCGAASGVRGAGSSLESSLGNVQDPELKKFLNAVIDYSIAERNKDGAGEKRALDNIGQFLIKHYGRTHQASMEFRNFAHIFDDHYSPFHEYLMPRGFVMTRGHMPGVGFGVTEIFRIHSLDKVDSFIDGNGQRRNDLFGVPIGLHDRVLLADRIFSSHDIYPIGMVFHLDLEKKRNGKLLIGIPYVADKNEYGRFGTSVVDDIVQDKTMHEIFHIIHNAPKGPLAEQIVYLAQLCYRLSRNISIQTINDAINYLSSVTPSYSKAIEGWLRTILTINARDGSTVKAHTANKRDFISLYEQARQLKPNLLPDLLYDPLPRNPRMPPDQLVWGLMKILYDRVIEKHPEHKPRTYIAPALSS